MHFFKSEDEQSEDFRRLSICCNKLSILSAHTTDKIYATKKTLKLSMTSHYSRQQIKFNLTSMKPAGIVIILVTAYQLSIAALIDRNLIVT